MTETIIPEVFPAAIGDVDRTVSPLAAAIAELDMLAPGDQLDIEFAADGTVTLASQYTKPVTIRLPAGRVTVDMGLFDQLAQASDNLASGRSYGSGPLTADPFFLVYALLISAGEDAVTVAA